MNTIAFFNNKGGVGKTSLVYHLAWMYAELGLSVIAADLDPQANLTSMFIDEDQLATLMAGSALTPRRSSERFSRCWKERATFLRRTLTTSLTRSGCWSGTLRSRPRKTS